MHFVEMPNAPHVDVTDVAGSRQALKWIIHSSSLTTSSSVPDMLSAALGRPFEGSPQNSDTRSDAPLSISTMSDERKKNSPRAVRRPRRCRRCEERHLAR